MVTVSEDHPSLGSGNIKHLDLVEDSASEETSHGDGETFEEDYFSKIVYVTGNNTTVNIYI